jgi:hypothetical protein
MTVSFLPRSPGNYSTEGIPTIYNKIQFRSLLEAKWARFFDLVGWKYEYEPFELNGWIPDFLLIGKGRTNNVFCEVKPITSFQEDYAQKYQKALEYDNIFKNNDLLMLGCTLPSQGDYAHLGWMGSVDKKLNQRLWGFAPIASWKDSPVLGFCHSRASYHDRISGIYNAKWGDSSPKEEVLRLWNRASNDTRWIRPL